MKHLFILISFIILCPFFASSTEETSVKETTLKYLQSKISSTKGIVLKHTYKSTKQTRDSKFSNAVFAYEIPNKGWALTISNNFSSKVIAYSFDTECDVENMPLEIKCWIEKIINTPVDTSKFGLRSVADTNIGEPIEPFLRISSGKEIRWNQLAPFNSKCPELENRKAAAGCVPTAMAQIMRYWEFPYQGVSDYAYKYVKKDSLIDISADFRSQNFNWSTMPSTLDEHSTTENIDEVSQLMYYTGVLLNTFYDLDGSGADGTELLQKGINLLGYDYDRQIVLSAPESGSEFTNEVDIDEFKMLVDADLSNKLPVLVFGSAHQPHAMVCDGYDANHFYHINYGWGGAWNGFYDFDVNPFCSGVKLFDMAYVGLKPDSLRYTNFLSANKKVFKSGENIFLKMQIAEENRNFASYLHPCVVLISSRGDTLTQDVDYTKNIDEKSYQIKFNAPTEEDDYLCVARMENVLTEKAFPIVDSVSFRVDNSEPDLDDLSFLSIDVDFDFSLLYPSLVVVFTVQNSEIRGDIGYRISVGEQETKGTFKIDKGDKTISCPMDLSSVRFGNGKVEIELDYENVVEEANEKNNIAIVEFQYNQDVGRKELEALCKLYESANGINWNFQKGWLSNAPLCTWDGISMRDNHVSKINMVFPVYEIRGSVLYTGFEHNDMSGVLPDEIGNLKYLEEIVMIRNNLQGGIPDSFYNLNNLRRVQLDENRIGGELSSDIKKLEKLEFIAFTRNKLEGKLPAEIFSLNKLREIQLAYNNLEGDLSADISKNGRLLCIDLKDNRLSGDILSVLRNFPNLRYFDCSENNFKGDFPAHIATLKDLTFLGISNNDYEGELPDDIGSLKNLDFLDVSYNQLTGEIPESINEIKYIRTMDFSNNLFSSFPVLSDSLSQLQQVYLMNNLLDFTSLENNKPVIDRVRKKEGCEFNYFPQKSIGKEQTYHAVVGNEISLATNIKGANNSYQWFKNGVAIQESDNLDSLVFTEASIAEEGDYYCEISNSIITDLVLETNPLHLVVDYPTGIEKNLVSWMISLYPNPVKEQLNVKIIQPEHVKSLAIIDMTGKVLYQVYTNSMSFLSVDLSPIKSGIYFAKIETKDQSYILKIIKA